MALLHAFEQLIINTEEEVDQQILKIEQVDDDTCEDGEKTEIMALNNEPSASTSQMILDALVARENIKLESAGQASYDLNPADIIQEEEQEESVGDTTSRMRSGKASKLRSVSNSDIKHIRGPSQDFEGQTERNTAEIMQEEHVFNTRDFITGDLKQEEETPA